MDNNVSLKTTENKTIADVNFELSYVSATTKVRVHSYVSYFQSLESTKMFCLRYIIKH